MFLYVRFVKPEVLFPLAQLHSLSWSCTDIFMHVAGDFKVPQNSKCIPQKPIIHVHHYFYEELWGVSLCCNKKKPRNATENYKKLQLNRRCILSHHNCKVQKEKCLKV